MEDFPLSSGALERFRLATRKRAPAGQVGAHLLRRRGQSLEFRDHTQYRPGDDYRHIDWRASARHRRPGELLIRRFEADEQLTLAVSIDNRPTMALLPDAPKLRLACWLAYALTQVAVGHGDRVLLHRLFGPAAGSLESLRGAALLPRARGFLENLMEEPAGEGAAPDLRTLNTRLPPTAAWLILTDLYFEDSGQRLARAIARAQQGLRWVILLDLDNWPQERKVLGQGARRIEGPGLASERVEVEIDAGQADKISRRIEAHKVDFLHRAPRGGLSVLHWRWPEHQNIDLAKFFLERFHGEPVLRRLFRRQQ